MLFAYKMVLIIGATCGIGKALATKLVENGTQVIISGRRKENLDEFMQRHGAEKVKSKDFDIMQLDQMSASFNRIPQFAYEVIAENPGLDCVFVNSGIQPPFDFSKPKTVDLDVFNQELIAGVAGLDKSGTDCSRGIDVFTITSQAQASAAFRPAPITSSFALNTGLTGSAYIHWFGWITSGPFIAHIGRRSFLADFITSSSWGSFVGSRTGSLIERIAT